MTLLVKSNKHFLYRSLRLGVGHAVSYSRVSCWADWASGFGFAEELGYCGNMRVQVLEWARLRSAFWPWVQEKTNGLLTITHQSLSQAINLLLHGVDGFMLFVLFSFIIFQSLPQNSCFM